MGTYFDNLQVYPVYPQYYHLQWELGGAGIPGPYSFRVYRSNTGFGETAEWEEITDEPILVNFFIDDTDLPVFTKSLIVYYKVVGVNPLGEVFESEAISLYNRPEKRILLQAKEIIRRNELLFRQYNGVELAILKRMQWGEECKKGINKVIGEITSETCGECFDTKFNGGYSDPVYIWGHLEPNPLIVIETADTGLTDATQTELKITNQPLLKKGDVVVELHNNNRWYIKDVQVTELKRYPVSQLARVTLIERSEAVYGIEVRK